MPTTLPHLRPQTHLCTPFGGSDISIKDLLSSCRASPLLFFCFRRWASPSFCRFQVGPRQKVARFSLIYVYQSARKTGEWITLSECWWSHGANLCFGVVTQGASKGIRAHCVFFVSLGAIEGRVRFFVSTGRNKWKQYRSPLTAT